MAVGPTTRAEGSAEVIDARKLVAAHLGVVATTLVVGAAVLPLDQAFLLAATVAGLTGAAAATITAAHRNGNVRYAWRRVRVAVALAGVASALHLLHERGHLSDAHPSPGELVTVLVLWYLARGLLRFLPDRDRAHRRASLLDALLTAVAFGLVAWTLVGRTAAERHGEPPGAVAVTIAFGLGSLVLLSSSAQLWTRTRQRHEAARILVVAILVLVAVTTAEAVLVLSGARHEAPGATAATCAGWLLCVVLMSIALLHPSTRIAPSTVMAPTNAAWPRLTTLMLLTGFVPVAVVLGDQLQGQPTSWATLLIGEAVMVTVLLVRTTDIQRNLSDAIAREHALRHANDRLVSAVDVAGVRAVLVETAEELLASGLSRVWLVEDPRAAGFDPPPHSDGDVHVLTEPGDLHSTISAPADEVLVVAELPTRSAQALALVVAVRRPPTTETVSAVDALAQCAGLALDRVDLGDLVLEQQSEERLRRLLQDASDVVAVLDPELTIRYVTPAVERVLGRTITDVTGASWMAYVLREDRGRAEELLERSTVGWPSRGELRLTARDGSVRHVDVAISRVAETDGGGYTLACHDVTQRHELEQQLTHQAFHDPLTGLANRALFQNRLRHTVERTRRNDAAFAVLFIDLDDFKTVNDSLGHAAGDTLLRAVGARITGSLREQDTAARLGGDEFAVILEHLRDHDEADEVATRLLEALAQPLFLGGAEVGVGASVGIAHGGGDVDPEALMRNADLALFEAKAKGKSQSAVFAQAMHDSAVDRLNLKADMRRGLTEGEFVVDFQPLFCLRRTGHVLGVEALVRWEHPVRGRLAPKHFVTLAEETGLVGRLGGHVLDAALTGAARLQQVPGAGSLRVAVNLSGRQLQDDDVVDTVRSALERSGVDPSTVVLEITESVLLPDGGITAERLHELTSLGVRLYIDDFGTGYSSLAYLRDLPVSGIKLAREFVERLPGTPAESGLVRTIRSLAETLGLDQVVAEGIETAEQHAALVDLGYEVGQGYFLARPTDEAGVRDLLARAPGQQLRRGDLLDA